MQDPCPIPPSGSQSPPSLGSLLPKGAGRQGKMYKVPEAEKHAHKENLGSWSTRRQGEVRSLQLATVTRVALRQARMTQPHSGLYRLPARGLHKVPSHTLELVGGRWTRLFQGWEPRRKGTPGVPPCGHPECALPELSCLLPGWGWCGETQGSEQSFPPPPPPE